MKTWSLSLEVESCVRHGRGEPLVGRIDAWPCCVVAIGTARGLEGFAHVVDGSTRVFGSFFFARCEEFRARFIEGSVL